MDLDQVTPGGRQFFADFKRMAKAGTLDDARASLQGLNMADALVASLQLAMEDRGAFDRLAASATAAERADFSIRLVGDGAMPQAVFNGVGSSPAAGASRGGSPTDYAIARLFILTLLSSPKRPRVWPNPNPEIPKQIPFYPEFLNSIGNDRNRIAALARADVDLQPRDDEHRALFSLGGFYDYNKAVFAPAPGQPGTSCVLFARSVLHAAGFNVINSSTPPQSCQSAGPLADLPNAALDKTVNRFDAELPKPSMGDIFWIQGDPFPGGGDSSHVGIILSANGDTWDTVEGGGTGHITRFNKRMVKAQPAVSANSKTKGKWLGKWCFQNDHTLAGSRPLQGLYNIDRIPPSRKMSHRRVSGG